MKLTTNIIRVESELTLSAQSTWKLPMLIQSSRWTLNSGWPM